MKVSIEDWAYYNDRGVVIPKGVSIAEMPQVMEYPWVAVMASRGDITRPTNSYDEMSERFEWTAIMPLDPDGSNVNYLKLMRLGAEMRRIVRSNVVWGIGGPIDVTRSWLESWNLNIAQRDEDEYVQALTLTLRVIYKEVLLRDE